jgi:hypothetical protein
VAVLAAEKNMFFPAPVVLQRAREIFPHLALAKLLKVCRTILLTTVLGRVNDLYLAFRAPPQGGSGPSGRPLAKLGNLRPHG